MEHGGQTDVEGGRIGIWAAETHSRVDQYQLSTLILLTGSCNFSSFLLFFISITTTTIRAAVLDHDK
jgi:hypothetical protein